MHVYSLCFGFKIDFSVTALIIQVCFTRIRILWID